MKSFVFMVQYTMYTKYIGPLKSSATEPALLPTSLSQGVYNCLLLVQIVDSACFLRHQLAAVFNVSLSVL